MVDKFISQNYNGKMRDLAYLNLTPESFLLLLLSSDFSMVSVMCISPTQIHNWIISNLGDGEQFLPTAQVRKKSPCGERGPKGKYQKYKGTSADMWGCLRHLSSNRASGWAQPLECSQPTMGRQKIPVNFRIMINNKSLSFQSAAIAIDMGDTTVSLWVFKVKRNVIKNLVLQKHWESKGKAPTQGPLLDYQVQGYGYTSKLWSWCQDAATTAATTTASLLSKLLSGPGSLSLASLTACTHSHPHCLAFLPPQQLAGGRHVTASTQISPKCF